MFTFEAAFLEEANPFPASTSEMVFVLKVPGFVVREGDVLGLFLESVAVTAVVEHGGRGLSTIAFCDCFGEAGWCAFGVLIWFQMIAGLADRVLVERVDEPWFFRRAC